jgi:hypothetical protein
MPRLFYVGALLAVATLLSVPISAQTSAPVSAQNSSAKSAPDSARVEHVVVRGSGAAMEVEIQTSGAPVSPATQDITGPDRIVVDFPGVRPSAGLRALEVNRGALKGIRFGLFVDNPPITRVVLDLSEPQSYRISTTQNAIVVKLGPAKLGAVTAAGAKPPAVPHAPAAKLQNATLAAGILAARTNAAGTNVAAARVSPAVSNTAAPPPAAVPEAPPKPPVTVTFENGILRIHAEKATFAQVLSEVQRQTHAEIAIPAGAEREEVDADLGPAPVLEVLASLLNGTPYNFILVGNELSVERVILTRRNSNPF